MEENDGLLGQGIRVLEAGTSWIRQPQYLMLSIQTRETAHKIEQNPVFTAIELEWLSQRSFNIAVQARSCDSRLVIRLLDLSMQVCYYLSMLLWIADVGVPVHRLAEEDHDF